MIHFSVVLVMPLNLPFVSVISGDRDSPIYFHDLFEMKSSKLVSLHLFSWFHFLAFSEGLLKPCAWTFVPRLIFENLFLFFFALKRFSRYSAGVILRPWWFPLVPRCHASSFSNFLLLDTLPHLSQTIIWLLRRCS